MLFALKYKGRFIGRILVLFFFLLKLKTHILGILLG